MSPTRSRGALACLLFLSVFGVGLGLLARPGQGAQDKGGKNPLDDTWSGMSFTAQGKAMPPGQAQGLRMKFQEGKASVSFLGKDITGTIKWDATKEPKQFDLNLQGEKPNLGIYRLEKDTLTLCFGERGERPTEFKAEAGSRNVLLVLKRGEAKPEGAEAKKGGADISLAAARQRSANNLKQLGLAMHNYNDTFKRLPGPAILSLKDGKPLLSWRVALLPYLEQAALYNEFKMDEPWDSAHNKKLLAKMPELYAPVRGKTKEPFTTYYQAFVGPDTAFEPGKQLNIAGSFPDGTSNTIFFVEAGEAVPWTKPADVPYAPNKDLPKLGGLFAEGFHIGMADGAVRWVNRRFDPRLLRLAITRSDGQAIDINKLGE